MSDAVQVALIGLLGAFGVPIINHILGARDRALASAAVAEKNREIRGLERRLELYAAEIRRLGGTVPGTGTPEVQP